MPASALLKKALEKVTKLPETAQNSIARTMLNEISSKMHQNKNRVGSKLSNKKSKWAKIAERIKSDQDFDDPRFVKAWESMKEDMKEVRENFDLG